MKKIILVLILISAIFILASCRNNPGKVSVISVPADTPAPISPSVSAAEPSPVETPQPSPEDAAQQPAREDVPGYLAVGLQKRSEMPPALERFFYNSYYWWLSMGPYSEQAEEFLDSSLWFEENASADLDGDGKEDNITLTGGEVYGEYGGSDIMYSDITIDIGGNELKLKAEKGFPFELGGSIVDIDRSDGKKEILINVSSEHQGWNAYIISYDNEKPHEIFHNPVDLGYASGTGYIMTSEGCQADGGEYNYISYYKLWKLKSDRSGFEPADCDYYPTDFQQSCWDARGNWNETQAAPTQWDQDVYKVPGGGGKISIKKGTPVFIGLYAKDSWLMILGAKGELLGWLDADKVDYVKYTNYAFEPEGD